MNINSGQSTPPTVNNQEHPTTSGHLDSTRERLLQSAIELFAEKGFAAASVRDICTRAEANIAAINYYFGSKDSLYAEAVQVVSQNSSPDTAVPKLADAPGDPEGQLAAWIEWFVQVNLDPRMELMAQFMRRELAQPTAILDQIISESVKPPLDALHELVQALLPEQCSPNELGFICASITAPVLLDALCETLSKGLSQGSMGAHQEFAQFCVRWAMAGLRSSGGLVSDRWQVPA